MILEKIHRLVKSIAAEKDIQKRALMKTTLNNLIKELERLA